MGRSVELPRGVGSDLVDQGGKLEPNRECVGSLLALNLAPWDYSPAKQVRGFIGNGRNFMNEPLRPPCNLEEYRSLVSSLASKTTSLFHSVVIPLPYLPRSGIVEDSQNCVRDPYSIRSRFVRLITPLDGPDIPAGSRSACSLGMRDEKFAEGKYQKLYSFRDLIILRMNLLPLTSFSVAKGYPKLSLVSRIRPFTEMLLLRRSRINARVYS